MYHRKISNRLQDALFDTPVVLICGARQTGKTTLVRETGIVPSTAHYITLDNATILAAAKSDPTGFISGLSASGEPLILDEVQSAPELFPAIKESVDRDRRPGRFLLTGSANVLLLPRLSESLAGRMEILTLWPLAQAEIMNTAGSFTDWLFTPHNFIQGAGRVQPIKKEELIHRLISGGYPEPLARSQARRENWFEAYFTTILQRDVRDISHIEGLLQLPRLLKMLAARTASLLNTADISRTSDISYTSLTRYLALLENIYLIRTIPSWSGNLTSRLVKSPKIMLNDTGMAAYLLGLSEQRLRRDPQLMGPLLENFAAMEIIKDIGWSRTRPSLFHWRTAQREETDLLLEARDGGIVGIEIKASATLSTGDFKGLRALEKRTGEKFVRGVALYTGNVAAPFGEKLFAVPISALWDLQ